MIIAIKEEDRIVVGYTNLETLELPSDEDYVDEENLPIKFLPDGTLFAMGIENRVADLLLYDETFLQKEITPSNIVKYHIKYIKETCEKNRVSIEKSGWANALVICKDNHLYSITPKLTLCEENEYVCHGYHTEIVKPVLDNTKNLPAENRIIKATAFLSEITKNNHFPMVITDTKTKEIKKIYKGNWKDECIDGI